MLCANSTYFLVLAATIETVMHRCIHSNLRFEPSSGLLLEEMNQHPSEEAELRGEMGLNGIIYLVGRYALPVKCCSCVLPKGA